MYRKLFIEPYFGEMPTWMDKYVENACDLTPYGYDMLFDTDLEKFEQRVGDILGITCPPMTGTRKVSDFRMAFGRLYETEAKGYDFWGHTDFDCVYGRVDKFVTEELLSGVDIQSNHYCYMCGPWSLYRNTDVVNDFFKRYPNWKEELASPHSLGWGEKEYSELLDAAHARGELVRKYTHWQANNPDDDTKLTMENGSLFDGGKEIMMHHFNRTKRWPPCLTKS